MTDQDKLAVIKYVYEQLFEWTIHFEAIGVDLAYLFGAIATNQKVQLTEDSYLMQALRMALEDYDPVFLFIEIVKD